MQHCYKVIIAKAIGGGGGWKVDPSGPRPNNDKTSGIIVLENPIHISSDHLTLLVNQWNKACLALFYNNNLSTSYRWLSVRLQ